MFSSRVFKAVFNVKINIERQVVFFQEKNEGIKRMMMINFRTKHSRILHMIKLPVFSSKSRLSFWVDFSHAKILHIQAAALLKYFLSSFFFFAQLSLTQIHSIFFFFEKGEGGDLFLKKKILEGLWH